MRPKKLSTVRRLTGQFVVAVIETAVAENLHFRDLSLLDLESCFRVRRGDKLRERLEELAAASLYGWGFRKGGVPVSWALIANVVARFLEEHRVELAEMELTRPEEARA